MQSKIKYVGCTMFLLVCACSRQSPPAANTNSRKQEEHMTLRVVSTAFQDGGLIPAKYTCDGENVSPPIDWSGIPQTAKSLALICDDPDAPGKTWVHWLVYDLPPTTTRLAEGFPHDDKLSSVGTQGKNDFGKIEYGGPCPPSGTHRYFFKLYALDRETSLAPGASKNQLL